MSNKFKKAVERRMSEEEFVGTEIGERLESQTIKYENNEVQDDVEKMDYSVLDMLEIKDEKKAKNKTYYLEESVIKAIVQISKKKKMSESKVVNDILKHILKVK